jgi:hypothetical protein
MERGGDFTGYMKDTREMDASEMDKGNPEKEWKDMDKEMDMEKERDVAFDMEEHGDANVDAGGGRDVEEEEGADDIDDADELV